MPDLLLELRSEEIPARMQRKAAGDLKKLVTDALVGAGLTYEAAREYWTPRRLTLDLRGLTARSADIREEIKGPSTNAPPQAVEGFLRKAGLSDVSEAHVHSDPKKGDFYVAHVSKPGRAAEEIITEVMPAIIRAFPWPKSMRWGKASAKAGSLKWVRPLQSIVCTFGPETEEPVVIPFEVDGIVASNVTAGHRFHAPDSFTVRRFDDYVMKLEKARVVLDPDRRKAIILADAKNLAFAAGLDLVEDEGLLEEVSGLVEWPVVLMGEFEQEFLAIPADVIRLTIKTNQKCFVLRGPDGALANRFILVANIEAKDGGKEIAYGNGKVVRARLSDALYFWTTDQGNLPDRDKLTESAAKFGLDLSKPLDQRMARLDHLGVTFHAKLGTQGERVARIARLAEELAPVVGADPEKARRAAVLAKADLTTEVVGEFPELQGAMGRTYAGLQGEDAAVAAAIEDHYKPQGPSDRVPTDPVSVAVALADKLDTLVGFWAIDEKPTGSKDPFALRRAALGVIRIVVENGLTLPYVDEGGFHGNLGAFVSADLGVIQAQVYLREAARNLDSVRRLEIEGYLQSGSAAAALRTFFGEEGARKFTTENEAKARGIVNDLLSFFHDRLKVYLRDQGARHDLIDAVLASGPSSGPSGHLLPGGEKTTGGGHLASSPHRGEGGEAAAETGEGALAQPRAAGRLAGEAAATSLNDNLLSIVRRVEALGSFLDTEDGRNLLAGAKRAANILAAEEKKGTAIAAAIDPALFAQDEEKSLFEAVNRIGEKAGQAIEREDFPAAMAELAKLREPVDSFFEAVLVNADDAAVRANRLALVAEIRRATSAVADFSRIAG